MIGQIIKETKINGKTIRKNQIISLTSKQKKRTYYCIVKAITKTKFDTYFWADKWIPEMELPKSKKDKLYCLPSSLWAVDILKEKADMETFKNLKILNKII